MNPDDKLRAVNDALAMAGRRLDSVQVGEGGITFTTSATGATAAPPGAPTTSFPPPSMVGGGGGRVGTRP